MGVKSLKKKFKPTERDMAIFRMIYRHRFLTGQQIKQLFFYAKNNKGTYAHYRLSLLQKEKYLIAKPLLFNGLKQSSCYFLTQRGIDALGYENPRKPQKNRVERWQFPYYIFINDVFFSLLPYGWSYEESREFKSKHRVNRGNRILGVLYKNGRKFGLYTISKNATSRQLAFLKNSISECSRIANITEAIVIDLNRENSEHIQNTKLKEGCDCLGLHILPANVYLEPILFLGEPELLIQQKMVGITSIENSMQLYAHFDISFQVKQDDTLYTGEGFLTQFLTNEQITMGFVKDFTLEEEKRKKRKMGLLVWEDDTEIIDDPFFQRGQFKILKMPRGLIKKLHGESQQQKEGGVS